MFRALFCVLCLFASSAALQLATVRTSARSVCAITMGTALKTGDAVTVISGADKGSVGKILSLNRKKGQVVVEGVNVRSKHVKPRKEGETGQILKKEFPVHISNVAFSDEGTEDESTMSSSN